MAKKECPEHIPIWRTKRYQVAALFFLGCVLQATLKFNLSIAIVCMVRHNNTGTSVNTTQAVTSQHPLGTSSECPHTVLDSNSSTSETEQGEFLWTKQIQGLLLGAMFWGFTSGQVLCGWLSQRYGARTVIGLGVGGGALLTLLNPLTARVSPYLFIAVRALSGLGLACVYPSLVVFWSRWAPPAEYSRMMGLSLSGGILGNAIVFPIGGLLCGSETRLGWASVFYFTGGITFGWSIAWMVLVRDSPANTPGISQIERYFLEQCQKHRGHKTKVGPTPWCRMLTSRPVIAVMATQTLGNYCLYMLLTLIPTYLYEIIKLDIKSNGLYSMLPLVCMGVVTNGGSQAADFLISHSYLSVGTTRKLFNTIGCVVPSAFFVGLAYLDCHDEVLAVTMLCLSAGFVGFNFCGHIINYGDIALVYGGPLSGIGNTFASLSGVIAPYVVSAITPNGTQAEWRQAFYVAAGVFGLAALVFIVFGSGETQPWAVAQNTIDMQEDVILNTSDTAPTEKDLE